MYENIKDSSKNKFKNELKRQEIGSQLPVFNWGSHFNLRDYSKELTELQDYLNFKRIKIDPDDYKEFIDAHELVNKLSDTAEYVSLKPGWAMIERVGIGIISSNAVVKVEL